MGVWIETKSLCPMISEQRSHPVWVCGLKLVIKHEEGSAKLVTPCMGVWIETAHSAIEQCAD